MNPAEWLKRTATRSPDSPALMTGLQVVSSYRTFAQAAAGIAASLRELGIKPGDRVALFMANRVEYLEAMYGVWWSGAAVIPINGKLHGREARWIIEDAEAALVLTDTAHAAALRDAGYSEGQLIEVDGPKWGEMRAIASVDDPALMDPSDLLWLFYTSGTTGKPKGVMMTAGNIASMVASYLADVDEVHAADAALYAAPMSHGAGIYNFMHVLRGCRHIVPDSGGFEPDEILQLAADAGPISMFAAPTMVRRLVDRAEATAVSGEGLRTIVYAGGPMYEADILKAVKVMGARFVQIYGQGECPMGITALSRHDVVDRTHPRWRERLGSVGTAQSMVHVAILRSDGSEAGPGEVGEIAVRGATVMDGYWRNPEATAKALKDGWLWTGDMGSMDADGYVTLRDRSKDMIISGGSNIYPREVEEVLLSHDAVREVAVVGRADEEWGEVVVAFIAREPDRSVEPDELDRLCLEQIARFKRPKVYHFVEALPKNNYGKVLKTELRARLGAADDGA